MTTQERKNFEIAVNDFFSNEDSDFYFINEEDFDKGLMIRQFNEYSESGLLFPYNSGNYPIVNSEEMNILDEWMEENGWIVEND